MPVDNEDVVNRNVINRTGSFTAEYQRKLRCLWYPIFAVFLLRSSLLSRNRPSFNKGNSDYSTLNA
jgi:hypothetical protein